MARICHVRFERFGGSRRLGLRRSVHLFIVAMTDIKTDVYKDNSKTYSQKTLVENALKRGTTAATRAQAVSPICGIESLLLRRSVATRPLEVGYVLLV